MSTPPDAENDVLQTTVLQHNYHVRRTAISVEGVRVVVRRIAMRQLGFAARRTQTNDRMSLNKYCGIAVYDQST